MTQLEKLKEDYRNILINWINEDYNREYVVCEIVSESDKFAINFADWCNSLINRVGLLEWKDNWSSYDIKELLEIFKQEKGLYP